MSPQEPINVVVVRIDERLGAVERDIRDIKNDRRAPPQWPVVMSSIAALGALSITLITLL